ncbi:probable ATP-dependent RNA helicase DDX20 [Diorhabda sublineata]|uniref:probable ATP-dependent RNA helicase DDX20 n=1 Tax=Diorhabda sublineata TaxID=1163346 RepID=UPI0024E0D9A4|nr:probable ATP-dependent RNA helicase DDX20 [Diorhabda sublineata]
MLAHHIDGSNRTQDVIAVEDITFESLLLSENVSKGLTKNGFKKPSPIQIKAIPIGRCGFDLIVKSKSGTGKTLVFSIIALESLKPKAKNLAVLILTPAREIAVQVQDVIKQLGFFFKDLQVESFIGGTALAQDKVKCKNCNIAVGTPGRIKHLINEKLLNTNSVNLFVLDEADKLLEQSFLNDINEIYNSLPSKKQIIATSATYPDQLKELLSEYMLSPTQVTTEIHSPLLLGLKQFVTIINQSFSSVQIMKAKNEILCKILSDISFTQCLLFTNYQTKAESLNNILNQKGWAATYISAAQKQEQRLLAINQLKDFKCRILISTDLTARGIDAANVDLVINYDIPNDTMTYLHRMGRAGRYGSMGVCINLASKGSELLGLQEILGNIGGNTLLIPKLPIFVGSIPELLKISIPPEEHICSIVNVSKDKTAFNRKIYEEKPENIKKSKSKKTPQKQSDKIVNMLNETSEVEDIKKQVSDMDANQILDSLLNENFKLESGTEIPEKDKKFDAHAVMELLSQNNPKTNEIKSNDYVKKKVSIEIQDEESLILKNKALFNVSQILSSSNTTEDQLCIEQHLNIIKTRDKNKVNEMSQQSISDILNILEHITDTNNTENTNNIENTNKTGEKMLDCKNYQPSTSKAAAEESNLDFENIFQFGHDKLVYSNDNTWKEVVTNLVKNKLSTSTVTCDNENYIEEYIDEDDEYIDEEEEYIEEEEYDEGEECIEADGVSEDVDTAKSELDQIPTHVSKKPKKESVSEVEEIDPMKWIPVKKVPTPEFQVIPTCILETRKNSNEYEDYGRYFEECSNNLWENGLNFDRPYVFNEWFTYEWEVELYGIRNCVQQSIYLKEMAKFQNNQSGG